MMLDNSLRSNIQDKSCNSQERANQKMDQTPKPSGTQRRFVITPDQIAKLGLTAKLQSVIAPQLKKKPTTPKTSEAKKSPTKTPTGKSKIEATTNPVQPKQTTPKTKNPAVKKRKSKVKDETVIDSLEEKVGSDTKAKIREKILSGIKSGKSEEVNEESVVEKSKRGRKRNSLKDIGAATPETQTPTASTDNKNDKTVISRRSRGAKTESDESINLEETKPEIIANKTPQRKLPSKSNVSSAKSNIDSMNSVAIDDNKTTELPNTTKRRGRPPELHYINTRDLQKSPSLVDGFNKNQPLTGNESTGVIHLPPFSVLKRKSWNVNNTESIVEKSRPDQIPSTSTSGLELKPRAVVDIDAKTIQMKTIQNIRQKYIDLKQTGRKDETNSIATLSKYGVSSMKILIPEKGLSTQSQNLLKLKPGKIVSRSSTDADSITSGAIIEKSGAVLKAGIRSSLKPAATTSRSELSDKNPPRVVQRSSSIDVSILSKSKINSIMTNDGQQHSELVKTEAGPVMVLQRSSSTDSNPAKGTDEATPKSSIQKVAPRKILILKQATLTKLLGATNTIKLGQIVKSDSSGLNTKVIDQPKDVPNRNINTTIAQNYQDVIASNGSAPNESISNDGCLQETLTRKSCSDEENNTSNGLINEGQVTDCLGINDEDKKKATEKVLRDEEQSATTSKRRGSKLWDLRLVKSLITLDKSVEDSTSINKEKESKYLTLDDKKTISKHETKKSISGVSKTETQSPMITQDMNVQNDYQDDHNRAYHALIEATTEYFQKNKLIKNLMKESVNVEKEETEPKSNADDTQASFLEVSTTPSKTKAMKSLETEEIEKSLSINPETSILLENREISLDTNDSDEKDARGNCVKPLQLQTSQSRAQGAFAQVSKLKSLCNPVVGRTSNRRRIPNKPIVVQKRIKVNVKNSDESRVGVDSESGSIDGLNVNKVDADISVDSERLVPETSIEEKDKLNRDRKVVENYGQVGTLEMREVDPNGFECPKPEATIEPKVRDVDKNDQETADCLKMQSKSDDAREDVNTIKDSSSGNKEDAITSNYNIVKSSTDNLVPNLEDNSVKPQFINPISIDNSQLLSASLSTSTPKASSTPLIITAAGNSTPGSLTPIPKRRGRLRARYRDWDEIKTLDIAENTGSKLESKSEAGIEDDSKAELLADDAKTENVAFKSVNCAENVGKRFEVVDQKSNEDVTENKNTKTVNEENAFNAEKVVEGKNTISAKLDDSNIVGSQLREVGDDSKLIQTHPSDSETSKMKTGVAAEHTESISITKINKRDKRSFKNISAPKAKLIDENLKNSEKIKSEDNTGEKLNAVSKKVVEASKILISKEDSNSSLIEVSSNNNNTRSEKRLGKITVDAKPNQTYRAEVDTAAELYEKQEIITSETSKSNININEDAILLKTKKDIGKYLETTTITGANDRRQKEQGHVTPTTSKTEDAFVKQNITLVSKQIVENDDSGTSALTGEKKKVVRRSSRTKKIVEPFNPETSVSSKASVKDTYDEKYLEKSDEENVATKTRKHFKKSKRIIRSPKNSRIGKTCCSARKRKTFRSSRVVVGRKGMKSPRRFQTSNLAKKKDASSPSTSSTVAKEEGRISIASIKLRLKKALTLPGEEHIEIVPPYRNVQIYLNKHFITCSCKSGMKVNRLLFGKKRCMQANALSKNADKNVEAEKCDCVSGIEQIDETALSKNVDKNVEVEKIDGIRQIDDDATILEKDVISEPTNQLTVPDCNRLTPSDEDRSYVFEVAPNTTTLEITNTVSQATKSTDEIVNLDEQSEQPVVVSKEYVENSKQLIGNGGVETIISPNKTTILETPDITTTQATSSAPETESIIISTTKIINPDEKSVTSEVSDENVEGFELPVVKAVISTAQTTTEEKEETTTSNPEIKSTNITLDAIGGAVVDSRPPKPPRRRIRARFIELPENIETFEFVKKVINSKANEDEDASEIKSFEFAEKSDNTEEIVHRSEDNSLLVTQSVNEDANITSNEGSDCADNSFQNDDDDYSGDEDRLVIADVDGACSDNSKEESQDLGDIPEDIVELQVDDKDSSEDEKDVLSNGKSSAQVTTRISAGDIEDMAVSSKHEESSDEKTKSKKKVENPVISGENIETVEGGINKIEDLLSKVDAGGIKTSIDKNIRRSEVADQRVVQVNTIKSLIVDENITLEKKNRSLGQTKSKLEDFSSHKKEEMTTPKEETENSNIIKESSMQGDKNEIKTPTHEAQVSKTTTNMIPEGNQQPGKEVITLSVNKEDVSERGKVSLQSEESSIKSVNTHNKIENQIRTLEVLNPKIIQQTIDSTSIEDIGEYEETKNITENTTNTTITKNISDIRTEIKAKISLETNREDPKGNNRSLQIRDRLSEEEAKTLGDDDVTLRHQIKSKSRRSRSKSITKPALDITVHKKTPAANVDPEKNKITVKTCSLSSNSDKNGKECVENLEIRETIVALSTKDESREFTSNNEETRDGVTDDFCIQDEKEKSVTYAKYDNQSSTKNVVNNQSIDNEETSSPGEAAIDNTVDKLLNKNYEHLTRAVIEDSNENALTETPVENAVGEETLIKKKITGLSTPKVIKAQCFKKESEEEGKSSSTQKITSKDQIDDLLIKDVQNTVNKETIGNAAKFTRIVNSENEKPIIRRKRITRPKISLNTDKASDVFCGNSENADTKTLFTSADVHESKEEIIKGELDAITISTKRKDQVSKTLEDNRILMEVQESIEDVANSTVEKEIQHDNSSATNETSSMIRILDLDGFKSSKDNDIANTSISGHVDLMISRKEVKTERIITSPYSIMGTVIKENVGRSQLFKESLKPQRKDRRSISSDVAMSEIKETVPAVKSAIPMASHDLIVSQQIEGTKISSFTPIADMNIEKSKTVLSVGDSTPKRRGRPRKSLPPIIPKTTIIIDTPEEKSVTGIPSCAIPTQAITEIVQTPKRVDRKKKSLQPPTPDSKSPPIGKRKRAAINYAALNEGLQDDFVTPQPVVKKLKTESLGDTITQKKRGRPRKNTTPTSNEEMQQSTSTEKINVSQNQFVTPEGQSELNEPKKRRKEYLLLLKNEEILVTEASEMSPIEDLNSKEDTDHLNASTPVNNETCPIPKSRRKGRPRKVILGEENMEISPTLIEYLPNSNENSAGSIVSKKRGRKRMESNEGSPKKSGEGESSEDKTLKRRGRPRKVPRMEISEGDVVNTEEQISKKCAEEVKTNESNKVEKKKLGGHIDVKAENETLYELQNRVLVKSLIYDMRDQMALAKANDADRGVDKGCVKCAVCRDIVTTRDWLAHAQRQHNNLAWTVGQPEMDLNNVAFVINTLARIYTKKKPYFCIKCNSTKKSVIGFLGHVVQCKRTNEEVEAYKIECTICGVKVMPYSYVEHVKCHKNQEEKRRVAAEISKQTPQVAEEFSPSKKREAAKRASHLIQSVSNEVVENEKFSTRRNYTIKKERIADSEYEKYITTEGDSVMCTISGCNNESKSTEEARKHFGICKSTQENKYCCKFCDCIFTVKREFDSHFDKVHADKIADGSDFEQDGSDSDSDGEQRVRRVRTGTSDTWKSYQLKFLYEAVYIKGISLYLNHWCYSKHLEFCEENYKSYFNLFSNVETKMILLDQALIKDYLPKLKRSMFVNSEVSPQGIFTDTYKGEEPFKQYRLFESNLQPSGYDIIFCGGPISSMSWVPTPHTREDCQQILAVSVIPDPDKGYSVAQMYKDKSIVQFWNLGILNINNGIATAPKLEFCLAHEHGPIWTMEWCPSGCYREDQLGLVAVGGTDSIVYGYRIPQPEVLEGIMYKADPIFKLVLSKVFDFNVAGQSFYATRISWSKASGHQYICVGYTNGVVSVFDLDASSDLLKTKHGDVLVYYPYVTFQGHNAAVTGVALYHMNGGNKWLATASYDRTVKFWNLEDVGWPLSTKKKCQVKETVWMNNWISTVDAHDDWSNPVLQTTSLSQLREFAAQHCNTVMYSYSSVNSVSASDWGNIIVQGNLTGELIGCYVKHLLPFTVEVPAKRFYMSNTKLLPKKEINITDHMDRNGLYDYKTTADNTSLVFVDFELKCYKKVMKSSEATTSHRGAYEQAKMDMYPIQSITSVRINPNRHSFLYTAVGYQTGFVRLVHSKFLSTRT